MSNNTKKDFIYSRRPEKSSSLSKQNKPKKNKTAMIILWLLFAFWTLSSVLSVFVFTKQVVKADTVTELYTFEGSNITVWGRGVQMYVVNNAYDYQSTNNLGNLTSDKVHPVLDSSNSLVNYRFKLSDVRWDLDNGQSYYTEMIVNSAYVQFDSAPMVANAYGSNSANAEDIGDGNTRIILGAENLVSYYLVESNKTHHNQFIRITRSSSEFVCNITRVDMGTIQDFLEPAYHFVVEDNVRGLFRIGEKIMFNFIRYYDVNDNYLEIAVPVTASKSYQPQAYFTARSYLLTSNISDSSIYKIALQEGYNNGFEEGYTAGYSFGNSDGYSAGVDHGYYLGVQDAAEFSFIGLIGAVVDAPIRALLGSTDKYGNFRAGLLSFEVLGVNLSQFVSGMFTVGLIILVLRKVLGK